jgi:hypothetical protein
VKRCIAVGWIKFHLRILEVWGSKPGPETGCRIFVVNNKSAENEVRVEGEEKWWTECSLVYIPPEVTLRSLNFTEVMYFLWPLSLV